MLASTDASRALRAFLVVTLVSTALPAAAQVEDGSDVDGTSDAGALESTRAQLDAAESELDDERAFRVFRTARAAFEAGDYASALPRFREAYELSHRAELFYNIAVSADRLGRSEDAIEAYERFLVDTTASARHDDVEQRLRVLRTEVAERTPALDPTQVEDPAPAPSPLTPAEAEEEGVASKWWLWTLVGVVVVGAAVGVGLGVGLSGEADPSPSTDGIIYTLGVSR